MEKKRKNNPGIPTPIRLVGGLVPGRPDYAALLAQEDEQDRLNLECEVHYGQSTCPE